MALGKRRSTVLNSGTGRPVSNASVEVTDYGTTDLSTIYEDEDAVTVGDNPMLTDDNGNYEYYAPNGRYTENITTNTETQTVSDVQLEAVPLRGSATYDPANLVDGAGATTTVTVAGAELGDEADASFSLSTQGIILDAQVTADDTVTVRFQNETGGAIDLASGTLYVTVRKRTG